MPAKKPTPASASAPASPSPRPARARARTAPARASARPPRRGSAASRGVTAPTVVVRPPATTSPLLTKLGTLNFASTTAAAAQLRSLRVAPADFAPSFAQLAKTDKAKAGQFAVAFAATMESNDQLGGMFSDLARAEAGQRRLGLDSLRAAGQSQRISTPSASSPPPTGAP